MGSYKYNLEHYPDFNKIQYQRNLELYPDYIKKHNQRNLELYPDFYKIRYQRNLELYPDYIKKHYQYKLEIYGRDELNRRWREWYNKNKKHASGYKKQRYLGNKISKLNLKEGIKG